MNIKSLIIVGDKYLIRPHEAANESSSGLIMENSSNVASAPVLGTVLKAGEKGEFKEGDQILFRRYSIDELKFITSDGEQTVYIVEGSEIVAAIRKEDTEEIPIIIENKDISDFEDSLIVTVEELTLQRDSIISKENTSKVVQEE